MWDGPSKLRVLPTNAGLCHVRHRSAQGPERRDKGDIVSSATLRRLIKREEGAPSGGAFGACLPIIPNCIFSSLFSQRPSQMPTSRSRSQRSSSSCTCAGTGEGKPKDTAGRRRRALAMLPGERVGWPAVGVCVQWGEDETSGAGGKKGPREAVHAGRWRRRREEGGRRCAGAGETRMRGWEGRRREENERENSQ